jgi:hypothetical protein
MVFEMRYDVENLDNLLVEVYRNLHNGKWSIRAKEGKHKGRVISYASDLFLKDAKFIVREKGRLKVNEKKVKGVHAFVVGRIALNKEIKFNEIIDVYYNPYLTKFFQNIKTEEELHSEYEYIEFYGGEKVRILMNRG